MRLPWNLQRMSPSIKCPVTACFQVLKRKKDLDAVIEKQDEMLKVLTAVLRNQSNMVKAIKTIITQILTSAPAVKFMTPSQRLPDNIAPHPQLIMMHFTKVI